jgi:hypothetical protein
LEAQFTVTVCGAEAESVIGAAGVIVTPVGSPEKFTVTLPVKPFNACTLT